MWGVREKIHLLAGHSFRVLRWEKSMREVQLVLSGRRSMRIPAEGTHWHYHKELQLTYFTSGEGTRFVGDRIEPFHTGDLVFLGENLPHYWHPRGQCSAVSLQWHFPAAHPFWLIPETASLVNCFKAASRGIRFSGGAASLIADLLRQICATEGVERFGLLMRVFSVLASALPPDREFISSQSFSLSPELRHQTAMQSAIRFLLANFREEVRLDQLLEVTKMSKPTFSRQFKKHSGKTLSSFLQHVRLDAVCRELAETDRPIIDVAMAGGFSEISFFNRIFRRSLCCSPSQYRTKAQAKRRKTKPPTG